jgi:hypothetical protein
MNSFSPAHRGRSAPPAPPRPASASSRDLGDADRRASRGGLTISGRPSRRAPRASLARLLLGREPRSAAGRPSAATPLGHDLVHGDAEAITPEPV